MRFTVIVDCDGRDDENDDEDDDDDEPVVVDNW